MTGKHRKEIGDGPQWPITDPEKRTGQSRHAKKEEKGVTETSRDSGEGKHALRPKGGLRISPWFQD